MIPSQAYIAIAIVALAVIVLLLIFVKKESVKHKKLTPLAALSIAFVISSMVFDDRLIGYSLIGIGVVLAVIDIILKLKKK